MKPIDRKRLRRDFYEVQKTQARKSLAVFALLLLFYVLGLGLLLFIVWTAVAAVSGRLLFFEPGSWVQFGLVDGAAALILAAIQYGDARRSGGAFILKRLRASPPDPSDRYHRELQNIVDAIRLAAGLPRVEAAVLPDWAVNSLAVIEPDGTPVVAVTEGLLADFARDEIEAVVAHEIGHIARGDAFVLTLVASTANLFERLREAFEPDSDASNELFGAGARSKGNGLGALAGLSALIIRLLAALVSRQRELLADAAAVELGRNPAALGRALYKADIRNTFVGDFDRTYSPLFIVAPRSRREAPDPPAPWFATHPPVKDRIRVLAEMAHKTPLDLVAEIKDMGNERERSKLVFPAFDEIKVRPPEGSSPARLTRAAGRGLCPRCGIPLADTFYEGVPIKICRTCLGKLVPQERMDRILARTEIGFSDALNRRADAFVAAFAGATAKPAAAAIRNPMKAMKAEDLRSPPPFCPECGYRLASRPYNYQYFLPIERCLDCGRIWFDADELEILQILVERAKKA
ncbi:MAG: zinc metalloprotease HtpX [Acidobacteriota bacterium]|nr:zinc metalloprotease HtpX [Acidobacteriota bacterium]